jgi:beta-phosphoglucomutase-like phosphatase (HAD superfamily)
MDERIREVCREIAQGKGKIDRQEIEEVLQLLKEAKNEQRQKEYEKQEEKAIAELIGLASESGTIREKVEKIVEQMQNIGYMEGYLYAIRMLEESVRR